MRTWFWEIAGLVSIAVGVVLVYGPEKIGIPIDSPQGLAILLVAAGAIILVLTAIESRKE